MPHTQSTFKRSSQRSGQPSCPGKGLARLHCTQRPGWPRRAPSAQRGIARSSLILAMLAVMALAAAAVWVRSQSIDVRLQPLHPAVVALGRTVYDRHCASCHGADFKGQANWQERGPDGLLPAPPLDASGLAWNHPDTVLFSMVKLGVARATNMPEHKSGMQAYEGVLSDDEIVAVLSYIKSTWPPEVQAKHDGINAAAGGRR